MHIDLFPQRVYKYHLDPTEIKKYMLERYNSYKDFSVNGTPDGWFCNVRTEFQGAFPQEISDNYMGILQQWKNDIGLSHRPYIHEIWMNTYDRSNYQEPHTHLPGFYSAIHYVMFNPYEHEGTTFCNPLEQINSFMFDGEFMDERLNPHILDHADIPVEEGDVLIFPSNLKHFVKKNDSKHLRMTISFNINRVAENTRRVFA